MQIIHVGRITHLAAAKRIRGSLWPLHLMFNSSVSRPLSEKQMK